METGLKLMDEGGWGGGGVGEGKKAKSPECTIMTKKFGAEEV